ncbi:hypothetical protein AB6A40_003398 [Gnathostoma spinigerum]|uniref:Anaphase-promoting complex subunit 1 n=1 Tax=Gnathostoma spinigerum TaxID=75299 RepID=A0ABD6EEZ5_9BILA
MCEQCASLFNISRGTLLHIPPSLALMICDILYSPSLRSIPYLSMESNYQPSSLPTPDELQIALRLRWPDDLRFNNATQMLDSSRPIFIPSRIQGTLTDAEHHELQDQLLAAVASRTMAQTFGRAAIELRTRSPLLNRPLDIPTVCLQGRVHPTNAPLDLSQTEMLKTMIEWSSYYSGVAAGLRLPDSTCLQLHSEWLSMSASCQQSNVSAGLMLAFGLNGHITNMNLFTIHELLTANDRLMSISILLGYAVSRRGTADLQVYKMVVTHLPFLMGPTLLELHIDPMVQTAALVSLGLLFACTSHIGIINQLINEIGRSAPPEQEPSVERYSYSLAAGFAIGLIALGKGDDLSTDVPFAENIPSPVSRLVVLMEGGRRSQCVFPVSGMNEYRNGSHPSDHRTSVPQSNHAKESENVNIHLTGGAAAVALGLVYLRTSNKWAANCLKIPSTLLAVETIRPDLLLIRTVARSLVLWDDIRGSVEWVEAQVPSIILIHKKRIFSEESRHLERHDWSVDDETVAQSWKL